MADEFPDPTEHAVFLFRMGNGDKPWSDGASVEFSSWLLTDQPPAVEISISGKDEAEVLGLREVLQKFADNWEPHDDDPPPPVFPKVFSTEVVIPEKLEDHWWEKGWVWAAIGAGLVLVSIIVTIILAVN